MLLMRMIVAEAWSRRWSSLLGVLAVGCAAAGMVVLVGSLRAVEDHTRMIQRDIGLNVRILPAETDMARYWAGGSSAHSMPEAYADDVARQSVANRLIPMLARRVAWRGTEVLLTGIAPERFAAGKRRGKQVFGMAIDSGVLVVGAAAAEAGGVAPDDEVELLGRSFVVDEVLAESGTSDDQRVYLSLADAQALLGMPGRISEIHALECYCAEDDPDPVATLRSGIEALLPGTRVVRHAAAADARQSQRRMVAGALAYGGPAGAAAVGLWIALLAAINARQRRGEIGTLAALGRGPGFVGALLLGRAVLIGLLGGLLGAGVGAAILAWRAEGALELSRGAAIPQDAVLLAVLGSAALAGVASLIPAAVAMTDDPASALLEE